MLTAWDDVLIPLIGGFGVEGRPRRGLPVDALDDASNVTIGAMAGGRVSHRHHPNFVAHTGPMPAAIEFLSVNSAPQIEHSPVTAA